MKILKISIATLTFAFIGILFMFSSCEKNDITANDVEVAPIEGFNKEQNAKTAGTNDALIYIEIPEEYLAQPDEEMILIEENGPFYTEYGEEVEGIIVIEAAAESGAFFTIGVSQNLVDLGLTNGDWGTLKPHSYYYNKCFNEHCRTLTGYDLQHCHKHCNAWAFGRVVGDFFSELLF